MDNTAGLAILLVGGALYMIPWLVAIARNHHQRSAICVLTLLLGWTGLGWIIALVWASTAVRHEPKAITTRA